MPQPNNRYDLLRQKKNNFKRQSFYVQANGVAPTTTTTTTPAPTTTTTTTTPAPVSDTLGTEDSNNVGTESLDYIAV